MEWVWITGKRLLYLTIPAWQDNGVQVGFSTRKGGKSQEPFSSLNLGLHVKDRNEDVLQNRELFLAEFDINSRECAAADQVHGTKIVMVTGVDKGRGMSEIATAFPECDGLITKNSIGLLGFFADCVPLYFFNPGIGMVGLAHAGWKGTAERIAEGVIDSIRLNGGKVENTLVAIGPCIRECCYLIGEDVAAAFGKYLNTSVMQKKSQKYSLNLSQANKEILISTGVHEKNILTSDLCTACNPDLFYSYRREGHTGRMGAFIYKRKGF